MPLDALYSTPIYSDYIENEKLVSDEIDAAIQKINFSHREDWGITHLLSDSNFKSPFVNLIVSSIDFISILISVRFPCAELALSFETT